MCKLKRIFTVRQPPPSSVSSSHDGLVHLTSPLPKNLDFPPGVQSETVVVNASVIPGFEPEDSSEFMFHTQIREPFSGEVTTPRAALTSTKTNYEGPMHLAFGSRFPLPPTIPITSGTPLSARGAANRKLHTAAAGFMSPPGEGKMPGTSPPRQFRTGDRKVQTAMRPEKRMDSEDLQRDGIFTPLTSLNLQNLNSPSKRHGRLPSLDLDKKGGEGALMRKSHIGRDRDERGGVSVQGDTIENLRGEEPPGNPGIVAKSVQFSGSSLACCTRTTFPCRGTRPRGRRT